MKCRATKTKSWPPEKPAFLYQPCFSLHLRDEYRSDWLDELAAGRTYVNEGFQYDDYGYFLTGHAPIRDSAGQIAGFAGVDFDLGYYMRDESRFRSIGAVSIGLTLLL